MAQTKIPKAQLDSTLLSNNQAATITATLSASSGTESILNIQGTVAQSGTAGFSLLRVNYISSSGGSGTQNILDLQSGGTSAFSVGTGGAIKSAALAYGSQYIAILTSTGGIAGTQLVPGSNGGTGVNNGTSTITIGGNFTISGAFTFTATITANTTVTFPTTGTLATLLGTETFVNKRVTPRFTTAASASTITPNSDANDEVMVTAQAVAMTLANPTGTPTHGQRLVIRIKDNGSSQTLSYGTQYRGINVALPTATTAGKIMYFECFWNTTESFWDAEVFYLTTYETAWTTYTPTVSAQTGTITTSSATGRYKQIGKTVIAEMDVTITTAGTGAGSLVVSLPVTANAANYVGTSFEYQNTAKSGGAMLFSTATTTLSTRDASGTTFIATGNKVAITITYEVP